MTESTVATNQGNTRYGFGLNVSEVNGERRIAHAGGILGFNGFLAYYPASGWHVAVISSSESMTSATVVEQIMAALTSTAPVPVSRTAPKPAAEPALRRLVAEIARGEPDYSRMGAQLAQTTRVQLPALQPRLQSLGAIQAVTFANVDLAGNDVFTVRFASGTDMIIIIGVDDAGIVQTAGLRPAAAAPAR